jgi:hypothetical protein
MAALRGLNNVIRNLNREIKKIEGRSLRGLILFGILIMNDTENTSPITPVDVGNLRASRFIVGSDGNIAQGSVPSFQGKGSGELISGHKSELQISKSELKRRKMIAVRIGFSAFYAFFVHEAIGRDYKRPGAGAKYLESSLKNKAQEGLRIIQNEAKIR